MASSCRKPRFPTTRQSSTYLQTVTSRELSRDVLKRLPKAFKNTSDKEGTEEEPMEMPLRGKKYSSSNLTTAQCVQTSQEVVAVNSCRTAEGYFTIVCDFLSQCAQLFVVRDIAAGALHVDGKAPFHVYSCSFWSAPTRCAKNAQIRLLKPWQAVDP